jgi:circadian clock protein KaiB
MGGVKTRSKEQATRGKEQGTKDKRKDCMPKKVKHRAAEHRQTSAAGDLQMYVLRLCISGMTARSRRALANLKRICDEHLEGQYQLEVIDLYQQPELAAKHQLIATPTLLKTLPPPLSRLIGDLSDTEKTLAQLGIVVKKGGKS